MTQQSVQLTAETQEEKGVSCFPGNSGWTQRNGACGSSKIDPPYSTFLNLNLTICTLIENDFHN